MNKHEIIEDLCHKVADIKHDLQVTGFYQLENEYHDDNQ